MAEAKIAPETRDTKRIWLILKGVPNIQYPISPTTKIIINSRTKYCKNFFINHLCHLQRHVIYPIVVKHLNSQRRKRPRSFSQFAHLYAGANIFCISTSGTIFGNSIFFLNDEIKIFYHRQNVFQIINSINFIFIYQFFLLGIDNAENIMLVIFFVRESDIFLWISITKISSKRSKRKTGNYLVIFSVSAF